jgi:putative transposase
MARFARIVVPGVAHHITQRGNLRQDVFFTDHDRRVYLAALRDHIREHKVRVLAWCLMTNHVHVIAIPDQADSLARAFGRTHNEYARWLHVRERRVGHLWQNRFHSCPLAGAHLWQAIRYTELNPVRARIVQNAEDWPWSSARAHLGGTDDWGILDLGPWREHWSPDTWRTVLRPTSRDSEFERSLREATRTGRPCGGDDFLDQLERETDRSLRPQKRGPKPKIVVEDGQLSFDIA